MFTEHPPVHEMVPPANPSVAHECPPMLPPSHASPASTLPFPQNDWVQPEVFNVQVPSHDSDPVPRFRLAHVAPFKFEPSHCSPDWTLPLPQFEQLPVSK